MGRPLKKTLLATLLCDAKWADGTTTNDATVLEQVSNRKYKVTNGTTKTEYLKLVAGPIAGGTANGSMTIEVTPEDSTDGPEYARAIHARQVKTFEGNTYVWNASAARTSSLPEADLQGEDLTD